ncbi:C2H2-type domain-containing protein [Trichoderma simmonsii]|uniref:C2H2-type domain-containing protein n=1 Tax=Trichoderma simmonsii TaxID=1491479 RepID=A0A8G0L8C0_9HYPO|nr:C2H2-type domain-containing protein [Trichoderma simmonsii]
MIWSGSGADENLVENIHTRIFRPSSRSARPRTNPSIDSRPSNSSQAVGITSQRPAAALCSRGRTPRAVTASISTAAPPSTSSSLRRIAELKGLCRQHPKLRLGYISDLQATMSVAYEPRSFIHEGAYPPIGDEHDHVTEQRYTDSDVAEHLSHYTAEASLLPDDRGVIGDERDILADDDAVVPEASQLDLGAPEFSSPLQVALHAPPLPDPIPENKEPPRSDISSPSSRLKQIPKPEREVHKKSDGKFHCPLDDCKEDIRAFSRKCEWNKHMDKHERPYRCPAEGCENLPGFTYSGGLLRHEREVHGKHGGPKNTVNCPHPNCKRHTGKGFSRQENLNEHLRRVHTNMDTSASPIEIVASPEDDESEKSGSKRKRRLSSQGIDELSDLRDEIKRVREENEKLKSEMDQQSQHSLAMMAQIAELQDALRHSLNPHGLGAPTAQMI